MKNHVGVLARTAALACVALLLFSTPLSSTQTRRTFAQQKGSAGNQSVADRATPGVAAFTERVKEYVKLREQLEGKLPKLSSESKPAEIEAHQAAFAESIKTARAGAKPGDLFTPDIADHVRKAVREGFKGEKLRQLRQDVLAADTKGVPLRVNALYPDTKELVEMPPTLLLKLPHKKDSVRFIAVNSNYMDSCQLKWLEEELAKSDANWKICFFHHPPYSSGKQHGSDKELRKVLEPLFVKHAVRVAFVGHEHFYERIKPQKGVYYFITGGGGKLRSGDVKATNLTEKSFDQDLHFMLVEIAGDQMHFQVISRTGKTIDSGIVSRR